MSKIINGGLYQFGAKPFEQQQFGTAGVEGVNVRRRRKNIKVESVTPPWNFSAVVEQRTTINDSKKLQRIISIS